MKKHYKQKQLTNKFTGIGWTKHVTNFTFCLTSMNIIIVSPIPLQAKSTSKKPPYLSRKDRYFCLLLRKFASVL